MNTEVGRGVVGIVEDDDSARKAMARLVQAGGFEPAVFESAEAFMRTSQDNRFLCLVVDVHLRGMSGVDLQSQLRRSGSKVPIIVMTAHCEDAVQDHAERNGCEAFLRKPFTGDALLRVLGSIADRPRA
jgi:FixJ family two-component response regulator